jgi:hypothetical protein
MNNHSLSPCLCVHQYGATALVKAAGLRHMKAAMALVYKDADLNIADEVHR